MTQGTAVLVTRFCDGSVLLAKFAIMQICNRPLSNCGRINDTRMTRRVRNFLSTSKEKCKFVLSTSTVLFCSCAIWEWSIDQFNRWAQKRAFLSETLKRLSYNCVNNKMFVYDWLLTVLIYGLIGSFKSKLSDLTCPIKSICNRTGQTGRLRDQ